MRPDLSDPAARAAYRGELRHVAIPWRMSGFVLVIGGAIGLIVYGRGPQSIVATIEGEASLAALTRGWALLVAAIVKRSRYHKARMAGE
jgi:hypothetical protein